MKHAKKILSLLGAVLLVTGFAAPASARDYGELSNSVSGSASIDLDVNDLPKGLRHAPGIQKRMEDNKGLPPGIAKKMAPRLFNITVMEKTETSARIVWFTNERADSSVWISTSESVDVSGDPIESSTNLGFFHSLKLTDLKPGTNYYYVVRSANGAGNATASEVKSFATRSESEPDTQAPEILSSRVSLVTDDSARISWSTNEQAKGRVLVSTKTPVVESESKVFLATELKTRQVVDVDSLSANSTYYVTIEATDEAGNKTVSGIKSFKTMPVDTVIPEIFGPFVVQVDADSALVIWATNERSDSDLWMSTATSVSTTGTPTKSSDEMTYFHTVRLTGLASNTTYYYVVGSSDASDNSALSAEASFTTK
ncbi:MAG: hypothetical protein A3J66_00785 [Candidatus Magasanikbacteria bacterium RIFCSPHIGHO2_02_FULL_47_14]|uniref:Fibronectin type-III domain-containing protein n=1 Tax=Candidatus Magasanikbacteria bacterium RIFCSPHIGHO2_02_FULL_47_14 TaxID=1798680 RepID=A0A1F6LZ56_9BACT|nr:MAG: hypothetical protein A3J66_00785 [Candidatus Magasanikbacteria bacterium RIFCSPHIGHO2_02_FULL_47_14]